MDPPARSERLKLVDPPRSGLRSMLDCNSAESVEPVRLDPKVCIWEAAAQLRRVDEQLEGAGDVAARR